MLRISSGKFRGRLLKAPIGNHTRPTQARLRQAMWNSIQFEVPGSRVLDLFAGSGAMGVEALSRGAVFCAFVDNSNAAIQALKANISLLQLAPSETRVLSCDWKDSFRILADQPPFDVIFADPPYAMKVEQNLFDQLPWEQLLVPGGVFCLESSCEEVPEPFADEPVTGLKKIREKVYGEVRLTSFRWKEEIEE